jgi:hypothetical protein
MYAGSVAHIPVNGNWYDIDVAVSKRISQDSIVDTRSKDLLDICIMAVGKICQKIGNGHI